MGKLGDMEVTASIQTIKDKKSMKKMIRTTFMENGRSISDVSLDDYVKYETLKTGLSVHTDRLGLYRLALCEIILEHYGCQKWEFNMREEVKERYGMSDGSFLYIQRFGNINEGMIEYAKQEVGDNTGQPLNVGNAEINVGMQKVVCTSLSKKGSYKYKEDIKQRIGKLSMELLDASVKEAEEIEEAISKLKLILSPK